METVMVQVAHLSKSYDDTEVVKDLSFEIRKGEVFCLLGPNGAGKSTTISMMTGLLEPSDGDVLINGDSVTGDSQKVKSVIGVVPQEIALYPNLSAVENLKFWGSLYGLRGARLNSRVEQALALADLGGHKDKKVAQYSGGMKRRLNIAVGLINHPQVLFMDEPTVGIDAQSRRHIIDTIKKLNQQGLTILYTTHHLDEVEEIADRIGIIDHGALLAVGTLKELVDSIDDAESIEFELETMPDEADLQKILAVRDVHDALVSSGKLLVTVANANGMLASLVQMLNLLGLVISSIKLIRPDLEAVFLSLTGRTLRD